MKSLFAAALFLILTSPALAAKAASLRMTHLRDNIYVVEDDFYFKENSVVYVGSDHVTVVGATWTPKTAALLAREIKKITSNPIQEVIDTNYHPDRAGGNAYFKRIGAKIISTRMTYDLLKAQWENIVRYTQKSMPDYPSVPLVLPDQVFDGDFELQKGDVKAIYLGQSHTPDGIFVYFPKAKVLYGNCILKEKLGNLDFANLTEYPRTLRKLEGLGLAMTTIIAGHWTAIHGPVLIDQYLRLLEDNP